MNKLNLLFIVCLFSFGSLSDPLPEDLTTYIQNLPKLSETILNEYTVEQKKNLVERMADILEEIFMESLKKINYERSMLHKYVANYYFEAESTAPRKQHSLEPSWVNKEAITKLMQAYHGKQADSILNLTYNGQTIPFEVSEEDGPLRFKIKGAPLTAKDKDYCLDLHINSPTEASLEWLGPGKTACPIVTKSPGNFLLTLVEDFAKTLGVRAIELKDVSSVRCPKNNEFVPFRTLRLFQTGEGWYARKGYFPRSNQIDQHFLEVNNFIKHPLSAVIKDVEQKVSKDNDKRVVFETALKEYKQSKNSDLFSDFMKWLYEKNCADYLKVYGLVVDNKFISVPRNFFLVKSLP